MEKRADLRGDEAGRWAHASALNHKAEELRYDSIGVGAGAALRAFEAEAAVKAIKEIVAWSSSDRVVNGRHFCDGFEGHTNADAYLNLNAQAWWQLRTRFYETFKALNGESHDPEMILSLDAALADLHQLNNELAQVIFNYNVNGKFRLPRRRPGTGRRTSLTA